MASSARMRFTCGSGTSGCGPPLFTGVTFQKISSPTKNTSCPRFRSSRRASRSAPAESPAKVRLRYSIRTGRPPTFR
jgi:hypothetical protein